MALVLHWRDKKALDQSDTFALPNFWIKWKTI